MLNYLVEQKLKSYLELSRWKEHVFFVLPLTLLGGLLAGEVSRQPLDIRILYVILGNVFMVSYAFMINDVEDAPDDWQNPQRREKNVVASRRLSRNEGFWGSKIVAMAGIFFYYIGGPFVFLVGLSTFFLSLLYSWRPVRLKAWPVTDILSHSLMLSGLLFLAGYGAYSTEFARVWPVTLFLTLFSVYGQLYNQVRDIKEDRIAGLKNTAILVGERNVRRLMYFTLSAAMVSFALSLEEGLFPMWLLLPFLASLPFAMKLRAQTDMRGTAAVDVTGSVQSGAILVMNVVIGAWLIGVII